MPGAQTKYYTRPKAATDFTFRALINNFGSRISTVYEASDWTLPKYVPWCVDSQVSRSLPSPL